MDNIVRDAVDPWRHDPSTCGTRRVVPHPDDLGGKFRFTKLTNSVLFHGDVSALKDSSQADTRLNFLIVVIHPSQATAKLSFDSLRRFDNQGQ